MSAERKAIVDGLATRVRNLLRSLDRQDRLETAQAFVGWLEKERQEGKLPDDAREMLLRALRVASDPTNYRILGRLDPLVPVEIPELLHESGLERVAVSERVNDLVQAGLAVRELVNDQVRGTALASGLVSLVEGIAHQAGERLAEQLASDHGRDSHVRNTGCS